MYNHQPFIQVHKCFSERSLFYWINSHVNWMNVWPLLFSHWWSADPRSSMTCFVRSVCIFFSAILNHSDEFKGVQWARKINETSLERKESRISARKWLRMLERLVHSLWKPQYSGHYSMPAQHNHARSADGFLKTTVLNVHRVNFSSC